MKHTKEIWKVDLSDTNGHGGWSIETGIYHIATVYANIVRAPREKGDMAKLEDNQESIANARLIASAPELLEACKEALPYLDGYIQELVEQAISRAEGK